MSEQFSVLIVEDDVHLALTLQDILHDAGYRAVAVHDGRTALALCSENEFDLAILDLKLPDTSGTKLAEDINKLSPETEYVINTGYASLDTAIEAVKQKRIISYETKPVDIDRFLFLARQVAERRKAQAALKQSEKRFQALIENASDLIIILDADGKIRYESPSVEHIIGYKPEERTGKSVFEFILAEDMAKATESFSQLLRDDKTAIRLEIRVRHKDGSWRAVEVISNNMLKNPIVGGIVLNIRDITERKKTEEALTKSEETKRVILDNVSNLVVYQDKQHRIVWANKAAGDSVNLLPEQLAGRHCYEIWHHKDSPCAGCPITQALESGHYETGEIAWLNGRQWAIQGYPVRDEKGNIAGVIEFGLDITERKKAEEALLKEKERAQKYLDIAGVMIVAIDANQTVTLINRKGAEILGYPQNEIIGKNWFDSFIPEIIRNQVKTTFAKLMSGELESAEYYENPVLTAEGKEKIIEWHNTICRDESGNITGTLSSGNDITERKKAEQALLKSERHYSALVQNLTDAIFLFKDGVITWCNHKVEEIYGYSKEELLGKHTSFFYPHDIVPSEFTKTISTSLSERGFFRGTATFRKKDNTLIYLEYSLSLMPNETSIEIIAVARDVSERKRAEDKLKESEERYRAFVEAAGQAGEGRIMIQETEDGRTSIIFVNDGFSNILGYSREETTSMSAWDLFSTDALHALKEWYRKRINNEDAPSHYDTIGVHKNGVKVPLELSLGYLYYRGKKTAIVYFRDITERKQAERMRERLFAELAEKTRELEQIVYVTSHDLRSPLVNIQGFTRELDQSFKEVNEVLKSEGISPQLRKKLTPIISEDIPYAIQYILTSSAKMDSLLSGLLRLSRLGRTALNIKQLDMNKLMAEVVASVEFQIKESGAKVEVDDLPSCCGDETQINQVFSNLLDNALKFLNPKRKGKIKIRGKKEKEQVVYCVKDNGIGIAKKDNQVIFEIFRRLDPGARSGEGLGLTIVRKILDRHGGRVWVESEPGKGSKFFVSLPAKEERK